MALIEIYHTKSYDTWNEFLNEFNEYTKQNQLLFTIYASKKSKSDDRNYLYEYCHYKCINHQKPEVAVEKSKITMKRHNQNYNACGCPVELIVSYYQLS